MAGVPPASPGADRAGRSEELTELELTLLPSHTDQRKVNYRVTSEAHQREGTEQGQVSGLRPHVVWETGYESWSRCQEPTYFPATCMVESALQPERVVQ